MFIYIRGFFFSRLNLEVVVSAEGEFLFSGFDLDKGGARWFEDHYLILFF